MFDKHSEELQVLQGLGFVVSQNFRVSGLAEVWQKAGEIELQKDSFDFFIDGMVVKIDDNLLVEELGNVGKTPRGWCAIKFTAKEVATRVLGVSWQVGRTGKVVPIAELEPVELMNTIVARATLHNYKNFLDLQLVPGDLVIVRKAGDIIPEIVSKITTLKNN